MHELYDVKCGHGSLAQISTIGEFWMILDGSRALRSTNFNKCLDQDLSSICSISINHAVWERTCTHGCARIIACINFLSVRNNKPSSLRQREARHQRSKIAAPFTSMRQARSSHPRRSSNTQARCTNNPQQGSVHEEPLAGRCDHLAAHGALPQLLAAVAVAAHHVTTWHQDHGWAVLVANGTCHAGPARGFGAPLLAGGSRIVGSPIGGHSCLANPFVA